MSRKLPKPKKSKGLRLDWDESKREELNVAAARCDLSHAGFARIALELLVDGKAVTLLAIKKEADRQIGDNEK